MAHAARVQQFVEDFASTLVVSGVPRMPARVFTCLLVSETGRMTAAELAGQLQVSAAAVSGAVQYLDTVQLVRRVREPGNRREIYVVEHDVWYESMMRRDSMFQRWIDQLADGVAVVGPGTAAGERLVESMEFFAFLTEELEQLRSRWAERKRLRSTAS